MEIADLEAPMKQHAERAAEQIRTHLAEDAMWAREASRVDGRDVPAGARWQWVACRDDMVLTPDPEAELYLDENGDWGPDGGQSLRSVEKFDGSLGPLPQFLVTRAEEVFSAAAGHIVRHDPAHVMTRASSLADVLADLERIAERSPDPDSRAWARLAICGLAKAWLLDSEINAAEA